MNQWLAARGVHYLFLLFSAVLGVSVAVVSVWADGTEGREKLGLAFFAGASAFGVVVITHLEKGLVEKSRKRAEERAIRAEADMAQLYSTTLLPLSRTLKELTTLYTAAAPLPPAPPAQTLADLDQHRKEVLTRVLTSAVDLTAPPIGPAYIPRARCTFYLYDPGADTFTKEADHPGTRPPRQVIDPVGAAHMKTEILGGSGKPFRIDGTQVTQSYLIPPGTGYEAVIAVPVIHGARKIGVLAVDAPAFSDFIDAHVSLMQSLANVLAAAYALR
ncbi:GAF domain-containing protein [Streptomyces cyaneofuscatus]|uniref:GAF domain-containing protein n=1 Tax=Streptomyces cyaneofuscatus TaxID=66883 RepID=UPI00340A361D